MKKKQEKKIKVGDPVIEKILREELKKALDSNGIAHTNCVDRFLVMNEKIGAEKARDQWIAAGKKCKKDETTMKHVCDLIRDIHSAYVTNLRNILKS